MINKLIQDHPTIPTDKFVAGGTELEKALLSMGMCKKDNVNVIQPASDINVDLNLTHYHDVLKLIDKCSDRDIVARTCQNEGCLKTTTLKCACESVFYCSKDCQLEDRDRLLGDWMYFQLNL